MDKGYKTRYLLAVYLVIADLAVTLILIAVTYLTDPAQGLTINLATEFLGVVFIFFLVNRLCIVGSSRLTETGYLSVAVLEMEEVRMKSKIKVQRNPVFLLYILTSSLLLTPALSSTVIGEAISAMPAKEDVGPSFASLSQVEYPFVLKGEQKPLLALEDRNTSRAASEEWYSYPIYGGEMTSIAQDPSDPQTVYVGTRDAGVFKTTDGGQSWQPARQGLTFLPIRSLQVDPQSSSTLYAGTDYHDIWKTTDGGASWFWSGNGLEEGMVVLNIGIDPQDTDTLYAVLAGSVGLMDGRIYKSENGGNTWATIFDIDGPRTLAIDPSNPLLLYVGTQSDGVFRSMDGGASWTAINDGLPIYAGSPENVHALALDPHHSNRLSAIVDGDYYIFENDLWQLVGLDANTSVNFTNYLYFHPTDSTIIYSAGSWFGKSTDGGVNWNKYLGWPDSGSIPEIAFHSSSPDTIYAASDKISEYPGGVHKTNDQGQTWTVTSQGITAVEISMVAVDPQNVNYVYAGDADGNLYRTLDGGTTWTSHPVDNLVDDFWGIVIDPLNSLHIYVAGDFELYESSDQGENFLSVSTIDSPHCIAIAPNASTPIYVGTGSDGIYKSLDGTTWTQKNQGVPLCYSGTRFCSIYSLAVDPNITSTVWAGTQRGTYEEGGILKSIDGGENWEIKGLSDVFIEAIAVQPGDSNTILVGARWPYEGKIYKSTDGGDSWQLKLSEIASVKDIVFDPRDPRKVYAATAGYGVLRSFDGGETWYDYSNGIFYPVVYSLAISDGDPALLVTGSYGSGLYWNHPSIANQVPNLPANPTPADSANDVPIDQLLSWQGGDPDGDPVTYTVAFGVSDPPPIVSSNIVITSYDPAPLTMDTTYYWRITATDGMSESVGPVWSFTTIANQVPNLPANPTPADSANDVPIDQLLSWQGGDPDGDPVTYTVAFGVSDPPPMVSSNTVITSYDPAPLTMDTTYYWRITATDGMSESVGPVWSFTTIANQVPNLPANPTPADSANDVPIDQLLSWQGGDPDGDPVTYTVAFGVSDPPPIVQTTPQTSYTPSLVSNTTYYWVITSTDGLSTSIGATWSFTTADVPLSNQAPHTPSIPSPADGATDVSLNQTLMWSGGDPDGDVVTYTVAFGSVNPPPIVATSQITSYTPPIISGTANLLGSVRYYWLITATDGFSQSVGPLWAFTTTETTEPKYYIYLPVVLKQN